MKITPRLGQSIGSSLLDSERWRVLREGIYSKVLRRRSASDWEKKPLSSEVLACQLRQRGLPYWSAWYVPYCDVRNDLYPRSHFNFRVDEENYHVLRTGAFPFVKFHISKRPEQDLKLEDGFYRGLKFINFGLPTLCYGLAGLLWAKHTEVVDTPHGPVTIYFWYKENRNSPN